MSRIQRTLIIFLSFMMILLTATNAFAEDNNRPRLGLGVSPLQASPLLLQHLRLAEGEGLIISNIAVGSELEASGLSQGDIVLSIDGHLLSRPSDLTTYLDTQPAHKQVTLDVIQKGEHRQIYLTLDNLPDEIVWKYTQPIVVPNRNRVALPQNIPGHSSNGSIAIQPNTHSGNIAQQMTFSSVISTDEGMKRSTVKITGSPDDPNSEIEITLDADSYKTTIGEIDKLPEDAQTAAKSAISQSGNFSFSFGSFGGSDLMDEMMRRHEEQMRMMDEFFNQSFGPAQPQIQPRQNQQTAPKAPKKQLLKPLPDDQVPVKPSQNDIRS